MINQQSFLEELDAVVARNSMLKHPFYQTWTMGKLSPEALREYAKQYYHFVQMFPTLISATHANTPDLSVRQELLENLIEEERGDGNHPGLWMKFAEALDVNHAEAAETPMLPETREAIEALRAVARDGSYVEGIAGLYAYESQIPEVAKVKIEGLKKFYNISSDRALSFFTVHQEADVFHSQSEKELLARCVHTDEDRQKCLAAAERSSRAMLRLLDGVYRAYVQPAMN